MQIIKALIISTYQLFYVHYKIIIILQNLYIFATGNENIAKQIMKKTLLTIITATALSSCCTVFTASKQNVTFMAPNGTKIYDVFPLTTETQKSCFRILIRKTEAGFYFV